MAAQVARGLAVAGGQLADDPLDRGPSTTAIPDGAGPELTRTTKRRRQKRTPSVERLRLLHTSTVASLVLHRLHRWTSDASPSTSPEVTALGCAANDRSLLQQRTRLSPTGSALDDILLNGTRRSGTGINPYYKRRRQNRTSPTVEIVLSSSSASSQAGSCSILVVSSWCREPLHVRCSCCCTVFIAHVYALATKVSRYACAAFPCFRIAQSLNKV